MCLDAVTFTLGKHELFPNIHLFTGHKNEKKKEGRKETDNYNFGVVLGWRVLWVMFSQAFYFLVLPSRFRKSCSTLIFGTYMH